MVYAPERGISADAIVAHLSGSTMPDRWGDDHPHDPATTSLYECGQCGAAFGITGQSTGSDADRDADEYFDAEVARHESGECTSAATS